MKRIVSVVMAAVMMFTSAVTAIPAAAEESISAPTTSGSNVTVGAANSFGGMMASGLESEIAEQEQNRNYYVYNVVMDGNTANVKLLANGDCELVVAIFDESGEQLITSEKVDVTAGSETAQVEFAQLPDYYYIRAFLLNGESMTSLSPACESNEQTKAMEEFNALTTDDFPAERVLNFDDDNTNNFAVFREGVVVIPRSSDKNNVALADDTNKKYVIENADDSFKSLKRVISYLIVMQR